jgi:L-seryl-tRNA(Ser) seleniumtransferase
VLEARAVGLAEALSVVCEVVRVDGTAGGGTAPGTELPGFAVALAGDAEAWRRGLLAVAPPVMGRVREGRYLLDVRTILPEEIDIVVRAIAEVAATMVAG